MSDEDKNLKVELTPEAKAKLDSAPPEIKAKMKDLIASFHQAMDAVSRGQHETFEDAMQAITGHRPDKIDAEDAKAILGDDAANVDLASLYEIVVGGHLTTEDEDMTIFAEGGIMMGLCGNPGCRCIHYGLKDRNGLVFADGKLKLEDVPQFVRDLMHLADTLADTLKQKEGLQ